MGELRSKSDGKTTYYLLQCRIDAVTVHKAFMRSDKPLEEIAALPDTDDFYLNIPDQPIRFNEEK